MAGTDPTLLLLTPLDAISLNFLNANAKLQDYVANKEYANIQHANSHADAALAGAAQVVNTFTPEELGALIRVISEYRSNLEQNLLTVTKSAHDSSVEAETLRMRLVDLATAIQTEQQQISQVVTSQQGQFSAAQEKRSEEFTEALRQAQQALATITSEHQGQFSSSQETRGREFLEDQAARQTKFNELSAAYSEKLSEQNADFSTQRDALIKNFEKSLEVLGQTYADGAKAILKTVEEHKERVEKLVGVVGNLAVTSGYLLAANSARKGMWFWQGVTVSAMGTLCFLAYKTLSLLEDGSGHFNWGGFAARVVLLGSLGVLAAYAGSQADKLFEKEGRNRKRALELEAIGPYLAPLPEDEQHKFRLMIGERSFGREEMPESAKANKSPATLLDLLSSKEGKQIILDLIKDALKKA